MELNKKIIDRFFCKFKDVDLEQDYKSYANEKSKITNKLKNIEGLNGFLIGGASQNAKNFIDIVKKTYN